MERPKYEATEMPLLGKLWHSSRVGESADEALGRGRLKGDMATTTGLSIAASAGVRGYFLSAAPALRKNPPDQVLLHLHDMKGAPLQAALPANPQQAFL